jgi:hypothetical protein
MNYLSAREVDGRVQVLIQLDVPDKTKPFEQLKGSKGAYLGYPNKCVWVDLGPIVEEKGKRERN